MDEHPHILIVEARYYEDICEELAKGVIQTLDEAEVTYERLSVPGAFEIPSAIKMAEISAFEATKSP